MIFGKKRYQQDRAGLQNEQQPETQAPKAGHRARTYCHICGRTEGPFVSLPLPASLGGEGRFLRCQACVSRGPGFKLDRYVGGSNPRRHLYECPGCRALLFCHIPGIPDAYAQFGLKDCPRCGAPLPTGEQISFRAGKGEWELTRMSESRESVDDIRPVYEQLTASISKHPSLSRIASTALLVKTPSFTSTFSGKTHPPAYQIWVVHRNVEIDQDEAIPFLLGKLTSLRFAGSQRADVALKKEGLEIVERIKLGA
jgi:hypothetical protein